MYLDNFDLKHYETSHILIKILITCYIFTPLILFFWSSSLHTLSPISTDFAVKETGGPFSIGEVSVQKIGSG